MEHIKDNSKHIRFSVQISKELFNEVMEQVESGYVDQSVIFVLFLVCAVSVITYIIKNEAMIKYMTETLEEMFETH